MYIKTLTGKTIAVPYDSTDTIKQLKERIEVMENLPVAQQRLIICGKQMTDDSTVADYNYRESKTVHLVLRLVETPTAKSAYK